MAAVLALRKEAFRAGLASDRDRFDDLCQHAMILEADGRLVCTFRLLPFAHGGQIGESYSGQFYDLSALAGYPDPLIEMGRFCLAPGVSDPDVIRIAWAAMSTFVDNEGAQLLFGCSSFSGTVAGHYTDTFALLRDRHLAPSRWLPRVKAPSVYRFAKALRGRVPDLKIALKAMPPLLRSYLAMGGWVSDHAVVDRDLNRLHVFTALEIRSIPAARVRRMRRVAS
ncbi:MAG: GNAT family N-acyltransferase [Pseudomonadota bacterium]